MIGPMGKAKGRKDPCRPPETASARKTATAALRAQEKVLTLISTLLARNGRGGARIVRLGP